MQTKPRKFLSALLALAMIVGGVMMGAIPASAADPVDITEKFTDIHFRAAVYEEIEKTAPEPIYDTDVADTIELLLDNKNIQSLAGIEYFVALEWLYCQNNQLTALPELPSGLLYLNCSNNQITALPALPSGLIWFFCSYNKLTALPELPSGLVEMECQNNQLTTLQKLPSTLQYLTCQNNQLTSIDATATKFMFILHCWNNNMKSPRDVKGYSSLRLLFSPFNAIFEKNSMFSIRRMA